MIEACGSVNRGARELGVGRSVLYRWKDHAREPSAAAAGMPENAEPSGDPAEPRQLRREVERLRIENDILKKAAVILGSAASSRHAG